MHLLNHLLSNIAVDYYRSIHPFLGSPFHQKVVVQISGVVIIGEYLNSQRIHGPSRGNFPYMLDCDKDQTKYLSSMSSLWRTTRNETISQFVLCKRVSTDVDPTQFFTLKVCLNWLIFFIFCSKQEVKCILSPAWIPQQWRCVDSAHWSSPCPGQARAQEEVILSLVLSFLSAFSKQGLKGGMSDSSVKPGYF